MAFPARALWSLSKEKRRELTENGRSLDLHRFLLITTALRKLKVLKRELKSQARALQDSPAAQVIPSRARRHRYSSFNPQRR